MYSEEMYNNRLLRFVLGCCLVPAGTAVLDAPCWSLWCSVTGNGWWDEYPPGSPPTSLPSLAWPPMFSPRSCWSTTVRLPPNRFVFTYVTPGSRNAKTCEAQDANTAWQTVWLLWTGSLVGQHSCFSEKPTTDTELVTKLPFSVYMIMLIVSWCLQSICS